MSIGSLIGAIMEFYGFLIIGYVLLSWIPAGGVVDEIRTVLGSLVEPYLMIFRAIIPPIGMVDISPIVALIALQLLTGLVVGLVR
jgi:uncharacterized protein YggT (Ycf19 family)